jgi:hypothetical protein
VLAFVRVQRRLLRAGNLRLTIESIIAITFAGNAPSVSLPIAGPGLGAALHVPRVRAARREPSGGDFRPDGLRDPLDGLLHGHRGVGAQSRACSGIGQSTEGALARAQHPLAGSGVRAWLTHGRRVAIRRRSCFSADLRATGGDEDPPARWLWSKGAGDAV